jgi:hypothetical protein
VPDLGVDADKLGVLQLADERQRVPGGGQQDVAARLVRLGLDREPQGVAVVEDVAAEDVERLLVPVQRSLAVNAPSLNIGCENKLVVAVVTTSPVSASARLKSPIRASRSPGLASKSNTSLSWKLTP